MPLTIRRADAFAKLNGPDAEDFDVIDDLQWVGRIYRRRVDDRAEWHWTIGATAIAPRRISGRSSTHGLAVRTLSDRYEAVKEASAIRDEERLPLRPLRIEAIALLLVDCGHS